jgi:molecular chaperone GrpE (heat shock protein)
LDDAVSRRRPTGELERLIAEIDFDSEHYYNLYSEPDTAEIPVDLAGETWTNLSTITADQAKLRGELARLRMAMEQLRLPAVETVGLDKVADQLRGLEMRLRPLSEILSQPEDEGRFKRILKDLLVVLDTLDRVFELTAQQPGQVSEGVMRGLNSVYQLLMDTLARHGLKVMEIGPEFDPHRHMAMGTEPNPALPNGAVSRVMLKGFELNGQVLRTAQVVVVKNL